MSYNVKKYSIPSFRLVVDNQMKLKTANKPVASIYSWFTLWFYREEERRRKEEEEAAAAAAAKAALTEEEEAALANLPPPVLPYSSLFLLSSTNGFRVTIHSIVTFPLFDVFIMLVIIASSIALAAEDPVDPKSPRNVFLGKLDYGFTCVFGIEVMLKVQLILNILMA